MFRDTIFTLLIFADDVCQARSCHRRHLHVLLIYISFPTLFALHKKDVKKDEVAREARADRISRQIRTGAEAHWLRVSTVSREIQGNGCRNAVFGILDFGFFTINFVGGVTALNPKESRTSIGLSTYFCVKERESGIGL